MDELAKEYIISFFDKQLMMHGDRPEAVRWSGPGQRLHYECLLDIGPLEGRSVLDFGCGKGDLCGFLRERGINAHYTGCDINEKLVAHAKQRYPGIDFRVFDAEQGELHGDFDYIFLCGVFNLKVPGLEETVRRVLKKLYARCRIGLAFNALSDQNPRKDFELNYLSPSELFSFAVAELSPYAALRQERIAYDFTLFVYRDAVPPMLRCEETPGLDGG